MSRAEQLPHFIRDVLGCQCPDSVLANIRVCAEPDRVAGIPLDLCIAVDNRLLVYVVCTDSPRALIHSFKSVFAAGKSARDRKGFNRFRLVVATNSADQVRAQLTDAFRGLDGVDDRQHLHVIDVAHVPT